VQEIVLGAAQQVPAGPQDNVPQHCELSAQGAPRSLQHVPLHWVSTSPTGQQSRLLVQEIVLGAAQQEPAGPQDSVSQHCEPSAQGAPSALQHKPESEHCVPTASTGQQSLDDLHGTTLVQPPHTLSVPPPPQVSGAAHVPQSSRPLHASEIVPQFFPCAVQVVGVQPQTFGVPPPPHVCGPAHVPHSSEPPQRSEIVLQFFPCAAQVVGVQPQTFGVPPPPHVCGPAHVPQSRVKPVQSPFAMIPQSFPFTQVVGVQHAPNSAPLRGLVAVMQ
jgi:hypothetical protein